VVAERGQSRRRVGSEHLLARIEEVGVGVRVAAADAAADLVELRQAEHVGTLHDERVGRGDVDAALDDRRGSPARRRRREEAQHHLLQGALVHLPVGHEQACLRHERSHLLGRLVDVSTRLCR